MHALILKVLLSDIVDDYYIYIYIIRMTSFIFMLYYLYYSVCSNIFTYSACFSCLPFHIFLPVSSFYTFLARCALFLLTACFVFCMQHVAMSNNTLDNDAAASASASAFAALLLCCFCCCSVECRRCCVALHARHGEHIVLHFESNMSHISSPAPAPHKRYILYPYHIPIPMSRKKFTLKIERNIKRFYSSTVQYVYFTYLQNNTIYTIPN